MMNPHTKELTLEQFNAIDPIEFKETIAKVLEAKGTYKFHVLGETVVFTIELPKTMITHVSTGCPWFFPWCN